MDTTADELAGILDLFGGLTRSELERAVSEAAYRADGRSVDEEALEAALERGCESFALIECERAGDVVRSDLSDKLEGTLFVAGPTAFPKVPESATDVPHILDVERRPLDRSALGEIGRDRLSNAIDELRDGGASDERRRQQLIDVSYDIEAWAPVELSSQRQRLEAELE